MKFIKWLLISVVTLVLLIGIGVAALVYLVDWNDFREEIQNQTKKQTGRDLLIAGDLSPSVFPWAGISIGEITLANAEGFGDAPFASIGSADVKVKLLPLLKKSVEVKMVELKGLSLDLQRAADGSTNWDDLVQSTTTTTTTDSENVTTEVEVEGSTATIAALKVGGIEIADANVSWLDQQGGLDAKLNDFDLNTGAIELGQPFDMNTDFSVASNSMGLAADIEGGAKVMIDLENQSYEVTGFTLSTDAKGDTLPGGALVAKLGADIAARLGEQRIDVSSLSLDALGIQLSGEINVTDLDSEPNVVGNLSSNDFSPAELFEKLGIAPIETADSAVLQKANLSLALAASPAAAALNDLTITLDDTTFSGKASLPSLAGAMPPVRFDFEVDAIDLDRYLPPVVEGEAPAEGDADTATEAPAGDTGDTPIELPLDLIRQLDVEGEFRVGSVKVSNLTTENIKVPLTAKGGKISLDGLQAALYQGQFDSSVSLDATSDTPAYAVNMSLAGIQADPLLADLLQKSSFLSGGGNVSANLTTSGNSVNGLTNGLNGNFATAFTDGSLNGINIGYQIRRAKAALTGKTLEPEDANVKTDFSSLSVGGNFVNGVMTSDDLDMRSPLLRLSGAGQVDLPGEAVDYTLNTLITGSAEGQGGKDLESLKGVKLDVPIRGTFEELAANFAGVILKGMKDNISGNLKDQAKALADQKAAELKAKAQEEAAKLKAKADAEKARLQAEAEEKLKAQEEAAKAKLQEQAGDKLEDAKSKLKGFLK